MAEILFKKVGRNYKQINDPYVFDGLSEGCWFCIVKPGLKSARIELNPDFTSLDAALELYKEHLARSIQKYGEIRASTNRRISEKEKRAWENFKKEMGQDLPTYVAEYASAQELADNAIKALKEEIKNSSSYARRTN